MIKSTRNRWLTGVAIVAAFALGIILTPLIMSLVNPTAVEAVMTEPARNMVAVAPDVAADQNSGSAGVTADNFAVKSNGSEINAGPLQDRDIIQNARATVSVENISEAVASISELAVKYQGYVESTEISVDPNEVSPQTTDLSLRYPPEGYGWGWVSIRVPSEKLDTVVAELANTGKVISSSTSKYDVTNTALDLRARIEASRASVQRLTELMAKATAVSELIEAEVALTERQAILESNEQQLADLDKQVQMSNLHVDLTRPKSGTTANPGGFWDGLVAGWNGLISVINGLVIGFGFLLPWLGILALVVVTIWIIRRARMNNRQNISSPDSQ